MPAAGIGSNDGIMLVVLGAIVGFQPLLWLGILLFSAPFGLVLVTAIVWPFKIGVGRERPNRLRAHTSSIRSTARKAS